MLNPKNERAMKKIFFVSAMMLMSFCFSGCITTSTPVSASSSMSVNTVRTHARFLTDRMAYELDFTPMQYEDCYEINYDFIYYVSTIMRDVSYGYYDAINTYYRYLDYRNDDLRYIMTSRQYIRFMSKEYFYRPIYTSGGSWNFRIYTIYSNRSFYYYDAPVIFKSYRGAHSRTHYTNGFYNTRYTGNDRFMGDVRITGSRNFNEGRRNDFGSNLRDRNQNPDYNNYNNRNSNNRTADPRYRDNSGNTNTPQINSRGTQTGERRGQTTTRTQTQTQNPPQTQTSSQTRTQTGTRTGTQTGTQTGTRSGNATPTTSTRGTRGNSTTTSRR